MLRNLNILIVFLAGTATLGCVMPNYRYGRFGESPIPLGQSYQQVVQSGGDHPKLDRLERIVHAPGRKLRQWFGEPYDPTREENDRKRALEVSVQHLADNGLHDVHIEHRRYAPAEQWQRLRENTRISPIFKYTDGAARVLASTIFPARVFHSDSYNPYTNTLSINSDSPANSVLEASAKKVSASATYPGIQAASSNLPFVSIYHSSRIASEALSYSRARNDWELERALYPTAYGNIGSSVFLEGYALNPVKGPVGLVAAPVASMVGGAVGSGIGSVKVQQIEQKQSSVRPR